MTKEEKIQQAYGEYWNESIDNNGWVCRNSTEYVHLYHKMKNYIELEEFSDFENNVFKWRPKSLQGIEDNNRWISVENQNDLPKDNPIDVIINSEPYQGFVYQGRSELFCIIDNRYKSSTIEDCIEANKITHFKPIINPKLPIY